MKQSQYVYQKGWNARLNIGTFATSHFFGAPNTSDSKKQQIFKMKLLQMTIIFERTTAQWRGA